MAIILATVAPAQSQPSAAGSSTFAARTAQLQRADGFVPFYWDEAKGRLLLEIPRLNEELLYLTALSTGVGSVEVMLDRGSINRSALVHFERVGPRVLLVEGNLAFRALTDNAALRRSVEESFPTSVLAAFPVEAEQDGRVLVDATAFFLRDATDVAGGLRRARFGEFRFDAGRSAIYLPHTRAFPRNTEVEATLTFSSEAPSFQIAQLLPEDHTLTVHQHHSFVALPEVGYRPRRQDPRVGFIQVGFKDYAKPFNQSIETAWIRRWRLEKKDPRAALSEPVKPIVYYLDRGIPEPIRSAMREGALWWNRAFEAAGFKNAFQVLDLPEGADPMDVRYSVIQWVHRADRGWSVGATYADPRTGEIICGKPRMDSHRVRTVHNYWQSESPVTAGNGGGLGGFFGDGCAAELDPFGDLIERLQSIVGPQKDEPSVMLVRIALLTAHEVGHTLGLPHNFSASIYGRGSVMDYFTPRVKLRADGSPDWSDAYMRGVGSWDLHAIRYGYAQFAPEKEEAGLQAIAREGLEKGILFLPDTDPRWNAYDDGPDPITWLKEVVKVRRALMARYGPEMLEPGEPVAALGDRLSLVYLFHRYAIEAAAKYIGGMEHTNALKGDGQTPTKIVEAARQREVLGLLLDELAPTELALPERVLANLPPEPFGERRNFDAFTTRAGYAFDQISAARTLAGMIIDQVLDPQRAARLVAFAERESNPNPLKLDEVIEGLIARTWGGRPSGRETGNRLTPTDALSRAVQRVVVDKLMELAANKRATVEVRSAAMRGLWQIKDQVDADSRGQDAFSTHARVVSEDIKRFFDRPQDYQPPTTLTPPPPGAPVGERP